MWSGWSNRSLLDPDGGLDWVRGVNGLSDGANGRSLAGLLCMALNRRSALAHLTVFYLSATESDACYRVLDKQRTGPASFEKEL